MHSPRLPGTRPSVAGERGDGTLVETERLPGARVAKVADKTVALVAGGKWRVTKASGLAFRALFHFRTAIDSARNNALARVPSDSPLSAQVPSPTSLHSRCRASSSVK